MARRQKRGWIWEADEKAEWFKQHGDHVEKLRRQPELRLTNYGRGYDTPLARVEVSLTQFNTRELAHLKDEAHRVSRRLGEVARRLRKLEDNRKFLPQSPEDASRMLALADELLQQWRSLLEGVGPIR